MAARVEFTAGVYFMPAPLEDPLALLDGGCAGPARVFARREGDESGPPALELRARRVPVADFAPPTAEQLAYLGVGLDESEVQAVQRSEDPLVLELAAPGARAVELARASTLLLECLARESGGLIWDEETRQLFTTASWHERRLDGWKEGPPPIDGHVAVHSYENDGFVRMVSLGMAKLGLPDLVIEHATRTETKRLLILMNVAATVLAQQGAVPREGRLMLDLVAMVPESDRAEMRASLREAGIAAVVTIEIARATRQAGDADNRLMELVFASDGKSEQEAQAAATAALLGPLEDQRINVAADDAELLAASRRAKAELPRVRAHFMEGLAANERLAVKAGFETPAGTTEWIWVEVIGWKDTIIRGVLVNEPFDVPALKIGAQVDVEQDSVFDYLLIRADGTKEGGETEEILLRRAR